MTGGISVVVALFEHAALGPSALYWFFAYLMSMLACFLVWRDVKREARPYDAEKLAFARKQWSELSANQKDAITRLLTEEVIDANQVACLEACSFSDRDFRGMAFIRPQFKSLVGRLIKEDATRPSAQKTSSLSA